MENQIETPKDLGNDDRGLVKRWLLEIKLADKREKEWKAKSENVFKTYRGQKNKSNSFNILWSNTETLRPAIYNSTPTSDVRKRYKDGDKLGKEVANVLSRSLEYTMDAYDFDATMQKCVLDVLLPGRALARVKYVPNIQGNEGEEEVTWESVECEHVQWDNFRILCAAKEWEEVTAISFDHRLTRAELVERFGEVGDEIPLDDCEDEDVKGADQVTDLFKTALIHEIWDKDTRTVLFIAPTYPQKPVMVVEDPLNLMGFFPTPRPVYAIEDSSSLVPTPLYELYKEQAMELDRVSGRINNLIKGLKLRGIYDSTLSEMSELMRGEDNDLFPAQNVTALLERGGLEKAIWMLPIKDAAAVLRELYIQRDQTKQVIYEVTGISDIVRGASTASETATAQQIKAQWGSLRIRRMQSEVQRFIRDLIRMKAEIIAEKFSMETIEAMTLLKLPKEQEIMAQYQQAMIQYQQAAQMAQMQGQQPPTPPNPPPPDLVTWEKVMEVLKSDLERSYRVDIETDSTIAASVESDMTALNEIISGLGATFNTLIPVVQTGALDISAVKEIALSVVRRAKLGNAVEDALDGMNPPAQPPQPQDNSAQVEQMRQQAEAQKIQAQQQSEQQRQQFDAQVRAAEAQAKAQSEEAQRQFDAQMEQMRMAHEAQIEGVKAAQVESQREFDRWKAQLESETRILVAQIGANAKHESSEPKED